MSLPTITERVVIRLLNLAVMIYGDLPIERPGEASEFRAVLDLAVGIVRARAAHRAAAETLENLKVVAGGGRSRSKKGSATAPTVPSHGSTELRERISA